jgi:hypothetical protein
VLPEVQLPTLHVEEDYLIRVVMITKMNESEGEQMGQLVEFLEHSAEV